MKMPSVCGAVGLLAVALAGSGHLPLTRLLAATPSVAPSRGGMGRAAQAAQASAPSRAFLDQYCETCHNNRLKTGGLSLDGVDPADASAHAEVLEKVVRKLRSGQMPPAGRPRADEATAIAFVDAIESRLDRAAAQSPNPGRVASRRLNRVEYVNAIEDLLALRVNGNELLPSDMAGFGFDNNADVLAITPGLMARYMAAATKISRVALASPDNRPVMQLYKVEFGARQDARMSEDMPFGTHGGLSLRHSFPLDGEYLFAVRLKRNGTVSSIDGIEEDEHEIELRVDHALVKRFKIGGRYKGPDPGVLIAVPEDDIEGNLIHDYRLNADKELELRVPVKAGLRLVTVSFTDSAPTPEAALQSRYMPGIDTVAVSGPFGGKVPLDTPSRRRLLTCQPASARDEDACARQILSGLARRAYRRPVTAADVDPLVAIYKGGRGERDFDAGVERALEALLSSPKFLIRVERDPAGAKPGALVRIADLELASRLSFFLWRSIPDDELLDVAERGRLRDAAVLKQQVRRMIADRRSSRFMNDFVEQWLQVRNIQSHEPDALIFQGFDSTLRDAMAKETQLFFESQVREDRPIQELLRASYTFLNERLARHYGVADVFGSHFRRVTLANENRFGLLGQASVLTTTSYANRTSVVLRGKWVLENLLGAPPPPPPPNVPPLKENDGKSKPTALRERMEAHRASPVCASCHARMDPLGFALERFDAIGRWRENDGGAEINSTITWAGRTVDTPKAFREALLDVGSGKEYEHTVVEKLLTYALGRGTQYYDAPTIRQLGRDVERDGYKWSSLVTGVVTSLPFQMRRVDGPAPAAVAAVR